MSRKWLLFLFCLSITPALVWSSEAKLTVRVNEATSKVLFTEKGSRVLLALDNTLGRRVDAHIRLEVIDVNGQAKAKAVFDVQVKAGANTIDIPVELTSTKLSDPGDLLWYRLRYQVTPRESGEFDPSSGVISLSEITPHLFSLQVIAPRKTQTNSTCRVRARTLHPRTANAIAGVIIDAELKFDGYDRDDIVLKQSVRTGENGIATLDFQIPAGVESDEGELEIVAHRGVLSQSARSDIDIDKDAQILVSTDKPLYQPGQIIHTRLLMFDGLRRALRNQKATVKIVDPESTTAFHAEVTTTRFGVASADWTIPENTRLGDYIIEVELEDNDDARGATSVKISRYDLPNFIVNVKPDRAYYLPGQDAEVRVSGEYLFGQPVKRGKVRVVREAERHWNYREQKYDTEEGDASEGDVDERGNFVAHIKLGDEHEELKDEDYSRFRDLSYAAFFTDASTNRTEQRRFDLRLTKDAIHVYVVSMAQRQPRNSPFDFYISTSYADGSPASCEVALSHIWKTENLSFERSLQTFRTNRYGLARVSALKVAKEGDEKEEVSLMFRARDNHGAGGKHAETVYLDEQTAIHVKTDKSLYREGEPIRAEVRANVTDLTVLLDIVNEKQVLQSKTVRLQSGHAVLTIPYGPDFRGVLTIAAYVPSAPDDNDVIVGTRSVLYPHDRDLKLKMEVGRENYRPGEDVSASFLAQTATGRLAESVLGVVIFDKAVEERSRTDSEFGGAYGFSSAYSQLCGNYGDVAGVTLKDLNKLDLSRPLPEGIDLVAEVLLSYYSYEPRLIQGDSFEMYAGNVFSDFVAAQINPLKSQLESEYQSNGTYPTNEIGLRQLALRSGVDFDEARDPWGTPYQPSFSAYRAASLLQIISAGPDKTFGSDDDFTALRIEWPYFRFTGEAINRAVVTFHARTGAFIRDAATLTNELRLEGIDLNLLRDPWGRPYQFEFAVSQTSFHIYVRASGPDRKFSDKDSDDVLVWTSSINYAHALQARAQAALSDYFKETSQFPKSQTEFSAAMSRAAIAMEELVDPWGRSYYVIFRQSAHYGDRVKLFSYANYGEKLKDKIEVVPVTWQVNYIDLRSSGEDGKEGTADDFNVASFSRAFSEQSADDSSPQPVKTGIVFAGATGAIKGTVTDPTGAVVPGARVSARNLFNSTEYATESTDEGTYILKNLPPGLYAVTFDAANFKRALITDVLVRSSNVTQLDVSIEVGQISETVSVSASSDSLNLTQSQVTVSGTRSRNNGFVLDGVDKNQARKQISTPRLREYFPETLVWQPSLETDRRGRAQLKFKLADNITTWKMSVIGSTEDGQIGTVEKEIRAFQPFFIEHDPPRILTEGDEISLPVVVRNYLDRAQPINLEIKPENWFQLLGPPAKRASVAAGDASRETFDFRATTSVKDGKQRITVTGAEENDAIEKPVTVHPDGEEKSVTASDIVLDRAAINLEIPQNVISKSVRAELKIYPNLLAHVSESVEGILTRPHGCGEQTISSAYPSLLLLRHFKKSGQDSPMRAKAERYLRAGYERLLNYRDASGGFTYWGRGEPNLALTAYALRFLIEARGLIDVKDEVINDAATWLLKQQRLDGSWNISKDEDTVESKARTANLTAYVARILAMATAYSQLNGQKTSKPVVAPEVSQAANRAIIYLSGPVEKIDEPYLIASYAIAAFDVHDSARTSRATMRLRALAHEEDGAMYWSLETNTPFYGWGLAGRIETTALAVQALARAERTPENDRMVRGGILFLLRQKDRYGVWYSTQGTINVLDALLVVLARDVDNNRNLGTPASAEIIVNGKAIPSVDLPRTRLTGPVTVDLTAFAQPGRNELEIRRGRESSPASVQAVVTYYLPWQDSLGTQNSNQAPNGSSSLRLMTKFDKTVAKIGEEISCHVEAERIGFRGYGMMLAEIGLPPGADVDRESLDKAIKESGWDINQYDILPDRIIVYLWPHAGGTKFDFKFKPRFGLKAQTAASLVYDYYNPEARAVVAPTRFLVK